MHKVKLATKITKEFNSKPEKQFHTIIIIIIIIIAMTMLMVLSS